MQLYPERLSEKIGFDAIRQAAIAKTRSEMGREILDRLQPSSKQDRVERLLQETDEMIRLIDGDDPFPLDNLHDVREFLKQSRAEESLLPAQAFTQISELIATARRVKSYLEDRAVKYSRLYDISVELIPLSDLEDEIGAIIDNHGNLRDNASQELRSIRSKLNKRRSDLRDTINKVMARAARDGMTSDEGATIRGGRMVIPIQAEYKRKIQGFVHDVSSSGQTVYLEPVEALNINNEIRQMEVAEQREIERILRQLTNKVRSKKDYIRQNLETLGKMDAISARARLSIQLDGHIPSISKNQKLYLGKAYNPILLLKSLQREKEEREKIVPLNLELTEQELCLMITGPNAGGKSVAMKTLGLCSLMMQSGFAIPAAVTTELPLISGLFVDMGDDQSIENDLSTFSSRLEWMRDTVSHVREGSLVLIDEAGAGTDPEEGGALFQALIETLMEANARVIVTTHHGSLKVFAHHHPKAVNGSMEFDQETLSPNYRFQKGVPGSSYAFEIAQRMKIDQRVLDRARKLVGENKSNLESLITELETRSQEADENRKKYEVLKHKMEAQRNKYEDKLEAIGREKEKIREKALKEAREIMSGANRRIEQAVEQISTQEKKDKEKIKEIRRDVEEYKKEVDQELEQTEAKRRQHKRRKDSKKPPKVGDMVRFEDGKTTGELVSISGNQAVVQTNGLKLKTKYNKLVKVREQSKKSNEPQVKVNVVGRDTSTVQKAGPKLDIRGYRGEEAIREVERYLDRVSQSGLNQVEIVHGKGEGILKKLVHEYLQQRKDVKSFDLAPLDQGGAGCTIVEL